MLRLDKAPSFAKMPENNAILVVFRWDFDIPPVKQKETLLRNASAAHTNLPGITGATKCLRTPTHTKKYIAVDTSAFSDRIGKNPV
jgi:hypothetical protein